VRRAVVPVALALLAACASGGTQKARIASKDDLSAIQAVQRSGRSGKAGAPVNVVFVSGTITNTGTSAMTCNATAFVLVDTHGNATPPSAQWCDLPSIAPKQSGFFNATFAATDTDGMQLRFVHPDGSYEIHDLILPPA